MALLIEDFCRAFMKPIRIAPDGALLDRVAEFTYSKKATARKLFEADPTGYTDAIAKFVQTLASSEKIVSGERNAAPFVNLKQTLKSAGRHEYSTFFADDAVELRRKAATQWLNDNWASIINELQDPDSAVGSALLGHMRREFYLYWVKVHEDWKPIWYSPEEESLPVPTGVLKAFVRSIVELARSENFPTNEPKFEKWIQQTVTSHFRIFGEYYLFLGGGGDDDYLPALTRSSLEFLTQKARRGKIQQLVVPFVGLAALKKVKHREGLIDSLIDWSRGEGNEIVEGMDRLQEVFRTTKDSEKRKKLLAEVEEVLTAKFSWQSRLVMNALKLGADTLTKKFETASVENVVKSATSKTYRWLYRIRAPEIEWQWRKRLEELLEK